MSELTVDERTVAMHALEKLAELIEKGPDPMSVHLLVGMTRRMASDLAQPGTPSWWEPAP